MLPRKPPSESVFTRAVEARAAGNSWEAVGRMVHRSARAVRRWPRLYAERWAAALRASGRAIIDDAANESVYILRELLRSKDDKIRAVAAWRLIYQRLEQCKIEQKMGGKGAVEPRSDAYTFEEFKRETSHEDRM